METEGDRFDEEINVEIQYGDAKIIEEITICDRKKKHFRRLEFCYVKGILKVIFFYLRYMWIGLLNKQKSPFFVSMAPSRLQ